MLLCFRDDIWVDLEELWRKSVDNDYNIPHELLHRPAYLKFLPWAPVLNPENSNPWGKTTVIFFNVKTEVRGTTH